MKELKLDAMVLSVSEKDPTDFNGKITDNKLSVRFTTPMSRADSEGNIKQSNFINIDKDSLIDAVSIISDEVQIAKELTTKSICIRVLDMVLKGATLPIIQYILEQGEESPLQKIKVEHTTIITVVDINQIFDVKLRVLGEKVQNTIVELIEKGKAEKDKLEEEKVANRKALKDKLMQQIAAVITNSDNIAQDTETETN